MLSQTHIQTVKATIPLLANAGTALTTYFYERMFTHNPELKNVFNMTHQKTGRQPAALFDAIAAYATYIDDLDVLEDAVMRIAHKHTSFNIQPEQYEIVGHHLIETLRELASDDFTPAVEEAWVAAYGQLADIFIKIEGDLYQQRAAAEGGWEGFREFRISAKSPESDLVTSFVFEPVDGKKVIDFQPGQYIGIKVHPEGSQYEEIRQYSLSTAPNGNTYRISVKREGDDSTAGVLSNYLHNHLSVGDIVELMPPAGDFYLKQSASPVVLISAGVGLTPMQAMLDTLAQQQYRYPVSYLHACKVPAQHSFKHHVESLKSVLEMQVYTWYENAPRLNDGEFEGTLQIEAIHDQLPFNSGEFYVCGPVPFMLSVKQQLVNVGVDNDRIHYELFGPHQDL